MSATARRDATFDSAGWSCAAWIYEPEGDGPFPCLVLAHGWSGVREQRLDAYAERFVAAGIAAVVFDYRHFGASEGQPRQLLDIKRQLEDWRAAIAFARSLPGVDPDRVAIWGSSFSGGHVQTIAAEDPRIAAVIAQVPFADGLRNLPSLGPRVALRMTAAGLRDQIGALLGRPPYMLPAVGAPGTLAVMTSPDAVPGFTAIDPPDSTWRNETPARIALHVGTYRPGKKARAIECPILYAIADDDKVTPPAFAQAAADSAPRAEVKRYPGGHFDLYLGEGFDRTIADQVDFLRRHLPAA
jgi:dienelactone hydrolase